MLKLSATVARTLPFALLMAVAGPGIAQQAYPHKAIRFVVPYPPGGSTDPMARLAGGKLAERWGHPVVVDNRPGGNTIIGTEAVAKAPADGYTILLASTAFLTSPSLFSRLPYDTLRDFTGVATIGKSRFVLVLSLSVPASTLQEFIALAKSRPGQLNFASSGIGANTHLSAELFNGMLGTKMHHIPYKGSGSLITDLIGGRVQLSFQVPITVLPFITSGKLKAIAITGDSRAPALPEVPTFSEAGLPGFHSQGWFGIVAPAATPKNAINKMSSEMASILAMPDTREYLVKQGSEAFVSTPEQVNALIKADVAKYAKIIKSANIKLEY
jgi:tripartite-type tricarboxylate transporter receptor subunit TctC